MREAGLGAAETYRQELQEKGASGPEVHIDVDRIMTTGVVAAAVAATLPRPVFAARR